jgi:CRISPR/Cas system-associated endonuclease/helicase Cas3
MNPEFLKGQALADRYNLNRDPEVKKILQLLMHLGEQKARTNLLEYMKYKFSDQILERNPFYPPPPAESIKGEIPIGKTESGAIAALNLQECGRGGILITGQTGSGKTNASLAIIFNLLKASNE